MLDVFVLLEGFGGEGFEFSVEVSNPVLGEEPDEIQSLYTVLTG